MSNLLEDLDRIRPLYSTIKVGATSPGCVDLFHVCAHLQHRKTRRRDPQSTEKRPKVVFAAVRERSGELERLAGRVETELAEGAAIKKEKRTFIPHITLCRARRKNDCPEVATLSEKLDNTNFGDVNVDGLVLMQSKLTRRGADYTVVERFGFR